MAGTLVVYYSRKGENHMPAAFRFWKKETQHMRQNMLQKLWVRICLNLTL